MKKSGNETETKAKYAVQVKKAKEIKDGLISFDMVVNGVTIYGCWYREYKTKEGKDGTMITFPSQKGNDDNYYNHCWFPISAELKDDIIKQLEALV